MLYTSAQPEGEAKMSGIFFPLIGSDHPHLPLLFSSPLFSSPTLPKFQIWDKFQGTFGQAEA